MNGAPVPGPGFPTGNRPVSFPSATGREILRVTQQIRRRPRNKPNPPEIAPRHWRPAGYALTTSAVPAASGAVLGSGLATLCSRSGPNLTADGPTNVTIYNKAGAIPTGTYVAVDNVDGDYLVTLSPCS